MTSSTTTPLVQYIGSVMAVAVISKIVTQYEIGKGSKMNEELIRGFLTFFAVSLCAFPVTLMLGGIQNRNRFFRRSA